MTNNTILISSYLQDELSTEERSAFEAQLAADPLLQQELEIQRQIMQAAVNAGIKMEFAKAIRHHRLVRRIITWGTVVVIVTIATLFFVFKQQPGKRQEGEGNSTVSAGRFINPPLAAANVPYATYVVEAAEGDTLYHNSGSVLCFPPNAFVDADGNTITGKVDIFYREFSDPVDFFLSGIPMNYDSAGRKYNFESSGMCEVIAKQNNIPVFVNPEARPEINLSVTDPDPRHNVYVLDTIARKWVFVGKDRILQTPQMQPAANEKGLLADHAVEEMVPLPPKPVRPLQASADRPTFSIAIDEDAFEELRMYDKQRFEVTDVPANNKYTPADAEEHWDDVLLEKSPWPGIYIITFKNKTRKVCYQVRPVLKGEDYTAALKIFEEKNKVYQTAVQKREAMYKAAKDSVKQLDKKLEQEWNAENERIQKMNEMIAARNSAMRKEQQQLREKWEKELKIEQERILKDQEEYNARLARAEALQRAYEEKIRQMVANRPKFERDKWMSGEIIRSFSLSRFGVWNCDHPQYPDKEMPIQPIYTSASDSNIIFPSIAVVYRGFNGITQFTDCRTIRVIPGSPNMFLAIKDSYLYYITYNDFEAAGVSRQKSNYTFRMRRSDQEMRSYAEVQQLVHTLQ